MYIHSHLLTAVHPVISQNKTLSAVLGDYDAISNKNVVGHNSITIMYIICGSL